MKTIALPLFPVTALVAVLSGCVQVLPPAFPTKAWIAPEDALQPNRVWEAVRAETPADLSKPLTLSDLADLALRNNAVTSKAWYEARAAAEQVSFSQGYFMPSVTAGAVAIRTSIDNSLESADQDHLIYGPALQLSYLVFNFGGGRRAAVEQALQTVYASNFAFNKAIQDTLLEAELAYYNVISAQAGVDATATNVLDSKAILEAATERRNARVGVDLDVLQAKTLYDQALYALANAQGQLKISWGLLAQSIGLPADTPLQIAAPTAPLPETLSELDMQRFTDIALARRPDIAALRASLASREAAIQVAKASRWPSLYLNGSVAHNESEIYGVSSDASPSDEWVYIGGVSLKWNLFDGFQTLSTKRTAEAQAEAARAQLKQAELGASAEIWVRFQNYATSLPLYDFSLSALQSATASWQMAMDSYLAGVKNILDVLNAETQLAQARNQQIVSRQNIFTAWARLAHATGVIEKGGSLQEQTP